MKNSIKILSFVTLGAVLGLGVFIAGGNNKTVNKTVWQTQQNQEREVTAEVTPLRLSSKENAEFTIILNTHSVNLDKSLKDISVLEDDRGNIYNPIEWSGGTGGHHLEGTLIFPAFSKDAKSLKLIIKQIGGADRVFSWDI